MYVPSTVQLVYTLKEDVNYPLRTSPRRRRTSPAVGLPFLGMRALGRAARWAKSHVSVHRRALSSNSDAWNDALRAYERDKTFTPDALAALTSAMPPTRVSITQLSMAARHATPQQSLLNAVFIHAELVARRAAMLQQFQQMPHELATSAGVQELMEKYRARLANLLRAPRPRTSEDENAFASEMREALPVQLGETRKAFGVSLAEMAAAHEGQRLPRELQAVVDRHIDRIFLSRVGIRFLVKHYLASREPVDGFMGIIEKDCCPVALCEATAAAVSEAVRERFGAAPPIEVHAGDRSQTFTFVPEHLRFVVGELLRNSSRAALRWHAHATGRDEASLSREDEASLPAVRVVVNVSGSSVTIKVADEAGGLPRSRLADVWSYHGPRLRGGIGMGLPLARLCMRAPRRDRTADPALPQAPPPHGWRLSCTSSTRPSTAGACHTPHSLSVALALNPVRAHRRHVLWRLAAADPDGGLRDRRVCHVQSARRGQLGALPQRATSGRRWRRAVRVAAGARRPERAMIYHNVDSRAYSCRKLLGYRQAAACSKPSNHAYTTHEGSADRYLICKL